MAKGIELPVNVLVIIVIAVLVLIALATLVATGVLSLNPILKIFEKATACGTYACGAVSAEDVTIGINVDADTTDTDTLVELCIDDKQCPAGGTESEVKKYCGCPGI